MAFDDEKTVAMQLITAILENAADITSPAKMYAALQQIIAFWKYIPLDLRKKAIEVFQKLWESEDIGISTDPDIMKENTEVTFEEKKVESLYYISSTPDRSALRLGQTMKELRFRGLEDGVTRTLDQLFKKYGTRGLSIGHMITTNDIMYFFAQCEASFGPLDTNDDIIAKKEQVLKKFDWWADNYTTFSLLIAPSELSNVVELSNRITWSAENTQTKFLIIHLISSLENISKLSSFLESLKQDKLLNYREMNPSINKLAFQYDFSVILEFA